MDYEKVVEQLIARLRDQILSEMATTAANPEQSRAAPSGTSPFSSWPGIDPWAFRA